MEKCEPWESFKGNRTGKVICTYNQKVAVRISAKHNEEGEFGELNTHKIYWMQEENQE